MWPETTNKEKIWNREVINKELFQSYLSKGSFANDSQEVKVSGPGTETRKESTLWDTSTWEKMAWEGGILFLTMDR